MEETLALKFSAFVAVSLVLFFQIVNDDNGKSGPQDQNIWENEDVGVADR